MITKALRPLATLGRSSAGLPTSMRRLLTLTIAVLGLALPIVLLRVPRPGYDVRVQGRRLGPRRRDGPVGCVRLREERLRLRPDPRALLPGHDARPGAGEADPGPARRRSSSVEISAGRAVPRSSTAPARGSCPRALPGYGRPSDHGRTGSSVQLDESRDASSRARSRSSFDRAYRGALVVSRDGRWSSGRQRSQARTLRLAIVRSEMPADWHLEALMVQAVAARTYAIVDGKTGTYFDF